MTNEKNHLKSKEAQDALNSIKEMKYAGLRRALPIPVWMGTFLALLIGTQVALLGAGIRTYNTLLIVLICIMSIAIINKNRLSGVTERITLSKKAIIISLVCIMSSYFILIIAGQYLKGTYDYNWAPYAIGVLVTLTGLSIMVSTRASYFSKFGKDKI